MKKAAKNQYDTESDLLLSMEGICKSFSGVHALKGVDFQLQKSEVHALIGENGAGKSTLVHILAGVCQQDQGQVNIDGVSNIVVENERIAQDMGVAMVFQEGSLVNTLTVGENIFAGRQPVNRWGLIDYKKIFSQAEDLLDMLGMHIDPRIQVEKLSPSQKQQVEIAKALSLNAKILIFDEPTSALTEPEANLLFELIRRLKKNGIGIVYISHRLEEIFQIADRVTVLKDGQCKGTFEIGQITHDDLISLMVGRDFLRNIIPEDEVPGADNPVILDIRDLTNYTGIRDVSLSFRSGEVTALAGLTGAGRTELAMTIFGALPKKSGEIILNGKAVHFNCPADAIEAGLGYLSEDRKESGLFPEMSIKENMIAANLKQFGTWWLNEQKAENIVSDFCQKLNVASAGTGVNMQNLSGGNQQKVLLSRWLLLKPQVLIVDEPTRGIDIGAKKEIHFLLHQLARKGTAVIIISSELPEVLAVADRIFILRLGHITGHLTNKEATEEKILRLASLDTEKVA